MAATGQVVRPDQPIAIELVSTIHVADGVVVDSLQTAAQLADWLRLHVDHLPPQLAAARPAGGALAEIRSLRDAVRRLFVAATASGGAPVKADVEAVNAATRRAPAHVELRWPNEGRPSATMASPAGTTPSLLAHLAADAIAVLAGEHGELRACGGPSCVLFFVAGNRRQAWCSPSCGNRARVARHYRRTREAAAR